MRTHRPLHACLTILGGFALAACAAPGRDRSAVYERPGATVPAASPAPATPPPPVVAAPSPPPGPAAPGTSDKGSRLARPTPIGQIAPEEAPPAR